MDQPRPLRLSSLRQKIAGGLLICLLMALSGPQAEAQSDQMIESDDPQVQTSGTWTTQQAAAASNGSYRYSSGAEADVLTLQFSGPSIEILYVAGPSLGTLAIDVDGTVFRTVITTAEQTAYQQSARMDYLSNESHTLRVYAQEGGIVAVDAFIIPTEEPTSPPDPLSASSEGEVAGETRATTCAPLNAIHRVSLTHTGAQASSSSARADISSDGRYVAFETLAALVPGDDNGDLDIYVVDRQTCTVQMVSVSSAGGEGDAAALDASISADGRFVAFVSNATNLVPGDTNARLDVFVHDRQTGQTTRVSVASGGGQSNGGSSYPVISDDGRYVAFDSIATNLVSGDTNGLDDIFVHDRQTTTTTRVSVATGGAQATGGSSQEADISSNGRFVTFSSRATNLVAGDTNGQQDVFVHDRTTTTTTRVSVATGGVQAGGYSATPVISADGRFVAFYSHATNLVTGDTNGELDVFVHDRQITTTTRVSVATGGAQATRMSRNPAISADGRFVVFYSLDTNLVAGDTNGQVDAFMHDRQTTTTTRISVTSGGLQGNSSSNDPVISADGRFVAFVSNATNLVPGDTNGFSDIFVTPRVQPAPDTLALFNATFQQTNLISTLADNPPPSAYTAFSAYAPVTGGTWVMGDWNGDGLDTLGVYRDGAFYFTNKSGESQPGDWRGLWIGILGPVASGRFSNATANDCVGAVDSVPQNGVTVFALYFTCDMSGTTLTPALTFQWLSAPLPDPTFTGTFQFSAGDFNGDGLDSVAVRRNEFIAYGNVNPAAGPAIYDLAQYIGTPGTGDNGSFVVGDWDGNGLDSFGLFYQNGELFYRNDLDFNSGFHLNQSVGVPFAGTVQVASWR